MPKTIIDSVTLNFTDLTGAKTGCTKLGSNKFWKGWVEDNGDGTANFECLWGATGKPGKDTGSKRGISLTDAQSLLAKKVKSKEKKGYTRLEVRSDQEEMAKAADKISKKPVKKSKLQSDVGQLLKVIYGKTSSTVTAGLSSQAGATADNPIGNLSDNQLDVGGDILNEIESYLKQEIGRDSNTNHNTPIPLIKGLPPTKLIDLTNEYMSNIPREIPLSSRGINNLHKLVISSYDRLNNQRDFLQLLRDVHLTKDVFKDAGAAHNTSDKEQIWYQGLNCIITPCKPNSTDFKKVADIFNNNQSKRNANWFRGGRSILRLKKVFKFTRKDTEKVFDAYAKKMAAKSNSIGNIFAWHGTRTENLLGISKTGLLMPENLPRGIHISGKAFGRGIYHAPDSSRIKTIHGVKTDGTNGALKSMNYTSAKGAYYGSRNTSNSAFMYLQEVALGNGDVHTSPCWDKHRPNNYPKNDFIYAAAGGCSTLSHDELVTFSQDAQIFRYLIEVEVR